MTEIGERIKRARFRAALTQGELAGMAQCHRTQVCRYERGHHIPELHTIRRLAAALDVTPSFLLNGTQRRQE